MICGALPYEMEELIDRTILPLLLVPKFRDETPFTGFIEKRARFCPRTGAVFSNRQTKALKVRWMPLELVASRRTEGALPMRRH